MSTYAPKPMCPRCGYDQSGIIATWEHSCPMEGVCSECGLTLRWEEILSPKFAAPAWSYEHAPRPYPSRFLQTHARATAPWLFWRHLRLEHPVVVRRLIIGMIAWMLACHTLVAVITSARVYLRGSDAIAQQPTLFLAPGVQAPPNPRVQGQLRKEVMKAFLWPYGIEHLFWGRVWFRSIVNHRLGGLFVFAILIPPGFLVLGETFRRCKVRFVHLVRGAAYSLSLPAMGTIVCVLSASVIDRVPWELLCPIFGLWLCVYWVLFVRIYLRLTHGGWVAAAMLTIAALSTLIVLVLGWIMRMNAW